MKTKPLTPSELQIQRLREDLLDTMDEELELELDDRLEETNEENSGFSRQTYFRELLRRSEEHTSELQSH